MRLERLERIEKTPGKFTAVFEDGTEIKVTSAQIADFGLYSGREIADDEYDEILLGIEQSAAKARALRILGSRNMSSREVVRRLVSKGERGEAAEAAVEWLEKIGAINDAEYALMIVRHYSAKGYGLARIKDELYRRGIARELWEEALEEYSGGEDAARLFLERKLRGDTEKQSLRRAADALYRRGFSRSEIDGAVSGYLENIDETEDNEL